MYLFALKSKEVQCLQAARNHRPIIQGTFELRCQNYQKSVRWTAPIQGIFVLICKPCGGALFHSTPNSLKTKGREPQCPCHGMFGSPAFQKQWHPKCPHPQCRLCHLNMPHAWGFLLQSQPCKLQASSG